MTTIQRFFPLNMTKMIDSRFTKSYPMESVILSIGVREC